MTAEQAKRPVVLVVDDEAILRPMAMEIVEEAGMEAIEAENADRAIDILQSRRDIAILFSDIKMPGSMDGLELAKIVRKRWPTLRIILTSGHRALTERELPPGNLFLAKPFDYRRLESALHSLA